MHNEFVFFTHDKSKTIQFDDKKANPAKELASTSAIAGIL